jgi:signal transduction histidine kinase
LTHYDRLSRPELTRALNALESESRIPDELKHLLRELQRHQLELEIQNQQIREAQQALEESRSRYADLYDFAPMACLSLDSRACIQELNLAGAALLRQERSHLRGQPFTPFVDPSDVSRFLGHVRLCTQGETVSTELGLRIGGARIEVQFHGAPLEAGALGGHMCRVALLDISELRQMQARLSLTERLAAVGSLAAGIAHEINNPLAFLIANLELATRALSQRSSASAVPVTSPPLEESATVGAPLKLLTEARLGAERIQDIVKDLSTFARPAEERVSPVDVQQVLELSVKMAMGQIRHRAQFVRDYAQVPRVTADGSRLGQVFLNLLVNAAQSIPEGGGDRNEIRLRLYASEQSVLVEVQDTGQGIAPAMLDRIFEPFFTTKSQGMGLGLGLAISHSMVAELGGELTVESEPGRGSTFRVRLPAAAPVQPEAPPPVVARPVVTRRGQVLIIDDQVSFGQSLRMLLSPVHEVTFLRSARKALAELKAGARYDAILCDLMMADMTGSQLYEELSQLLPEQARRMIFMTGGAFTPTSIDFVARMSGSILTKPFKLDELELLLTPLLQ